MSRVSLSATPPSVSTLRWPHLYFGIGFTTLATLMLELALTRIFSVVFFYNSAFLAISVALFGLGAGGIFSYYVSSGSEKTLKNGDKQLCPRPQGAVDPLSTAGTEQSVPNFQHPPKSPYRALGTLGVGASLAVVASLWFELTRSASLNVYFISAVYLTSAIPFLLAGAIVSIAIAEAMERVDKAYFCDLAGAAAGCLLLIPFLNLFGAPNTVIAAGAIYAIAASIWYHQAGAEKSRAAAVVLALLLVALILINVRQHWLDIRSAKGRALTSERFSAWNSFSRIGVERVDVTWESRAYWSIIIDGDAGTGIAPYDWSKGLNDEERRGLLRQGPGFPYALKPAAKTLVIGPGGGYDVARALASGSRDITGVEINPIIANRVMRELMAGENHGIYSLPEVRLIVEDGRSFIRRTSEKYQILQATLVDTWASTAAGAFALSENNLYTTDAFYDYFSHLTDDGILAFTRWGFDPPRESLRIVSLAAAALEKLGQTDIASHVIVVREDSTRLQGWGALDTVVISRKPFPAELTERARKLIPDGKLESIYLPGDPPANAFGQMLASPDREAFFRGYRYDVTPVKDDRPFFFYTVQPRDLWDFVRNPNTRSADFKVNKAVPLLVGLVAVSLVATALILVLPRLLLRSRLPKQKGVITFLWYFLCLGAGYILVQVALIQKFILLLGQPTYALTVIVFSMLVSSGLGSFFSRRVAGATDRTLIRILAAVAILIAALAFGAAPLTSIAATWPLAAKMALTAAVIAPAAFLMGMPFPSGLRRLETWHSPSVRWAWSLNSAASVLGSAAAIFLAIYLGLRVTLLIGAALYLCALAAVVATRTLSARAVETL